MKSTQMFKTLALFAATALFGLGVQAQGVYPDKSIRMVVPYNAGGGTDVLARSHRRGRWQDPETANRCRQQARCQRYDRL
jgi:hypothetical protein